LTILLLLLISKTLLILVSILSSTLALSTLVDTPMLSWELSYSIPPLWRRHSSTLLFPSVDAHLLLTAISLLEDSRLLRLVCRFTARVLTPLLNSLKIIPSLRRLSSLVLNHILNTNLLRSKWEALVVWFPSFSKVEKNKLLSSYLLASSLSLQNHSEVSRVRIYLVIIVFFLTYFISSSTHWASRFNDSCLSARWS